MLFQSQQLDPESGLYYLRARMYDPVIGRFISRDPMEGDLTSPQTQNPYAYSLNNPVMYEDPSGERVAGACLTGNIGLAVFGTCSICIVGTSTKEVGLLISPGVGGSTGLATGIGLQGLYSPNANSLKDISGQDVVAGGSAWAVQGDVSISKDNPNIKTFTAGPVVGPDFGIPFSPVEFHGGTTYDQTIPLFNF